jgi:hypothetical protein
MVCPLDGRHKAVANIPTANPSFVIAIMLLPVTQFQLRRLLARRFRNIAGIDASLRRLLKETPQRLQQMRSMLGKLGCQS